MDVNYEVIPIWMAGLLIFFMDNKEAECVSGRKSQIDLQKMYLELVTYGSCLSSNVRSRETGP